MSVDREFGKGKVDAVYPGQHHRREPGGVVERTVAKKGTGANWPRPTWTTCIPDEGRRLPPGTPIRPRSRPCSETRRPVQADPAVHRGQVFGSLVEAQKVHFNDGGQFDKLYRPANKGRRGDLHCHAWVARLRQPCPGGAQARAARFGLTLGYTLFYLSIIVLIPLWRCCSKTFSLTWPQFWEAISAPRALASLPADVGASFIAACVNLVFGLLIAWVLVRYQFPGKKIVDAWWICRSPCPPPWPAFR